MFKSTLLVVATLLTHGAFATPPVATTAPVILPIAGAYAPATGYDDNDNIEIIIDGVLPNSCWVIDRADAKLTGASNDIIVQQLARKKDTALCQDETKLPPELKLPVTFMTTASLGALPAGTYNMIFSALPEGNLQQKRFSIERAPTNEVDSLYYAITTGLKVPKTVDSTTKTFEVEFSGYLSNPCSKLEDHVHAVFQSDVIVLMPEVRRVDGPCVPIAEDFNRKLTIATPTAGRYLVQVRSANGNSVNHFLTVK